jgi:hypothetical protein
VKAVRLRLSVTDPSDRTFLLCGGCICESRGTHREVFFPVRLNNGKAANEILGLKIYYAGFYYGNCGPVRYCHWSVVTAW